VFQSSSGLDFMNAVDVIRLSLIEAGVLSGVPGVRRMFWARRQQVVATLFIVVLAAVDFSTCLVLMALNGL